MYDMSLRLTPPPSSPQSHDLKTAVPRTGIPYSPCQTFKTRELVSDDKSDVGISQILNTPVRTHLPEHHVLRGGRYVGRRPSKVLLGERSECSEDYLLTYLPPTIRNISAHARKARGKFPPYHKSHSPKPVELRFAEKSLGRHASDDFTLEDVQAVKLLILPYIHASSPALFRALAMKEADRESVRLRTLTTAWELEATNCWKDFLLAVQADDIQKFFDSAEELQFFMTIMECCSVDELKDEEDFHVAAYGQDLTSLALEDERLNQMEGASGDCKAGKEANSEDDLTAILAAAVNVDSIETDGSDEDQDE
ncbi:hypothetical protein PISMIDRAFT_23785 [Pisolithus microcarpus 441]|uniref:Uncharacterized protein n=1 Tax=Pisolithus microcarpus 441 TaxID=765257 RepID=A0A0C9ZQZ0_9AGAM|nr:hypothetical protein BKA83DRAFT_23785 [Pisolithus microcarpus]KIK22138.1 hypothetical protein PISMIDRAFT_23785 [Pisolithus microcarpus 441]